MRATDIEFKLRGMWIGLIVGLSFQFYIVDHQNFAVALAKLMSSSAEPSLGAVRGIFIGAAVLSFAAALLRTWAASYLRKEVVHDAALHSDVLVADGPYRFVRNPLYLGTDLFAIATGTLASRLGFFAMVGLIVLFNYRLIRREESELEAQQGETFREFCRRVPRIVPALSPRVPSGERQPDWLSGFAGESYFWAFAIGMTVYAATLKLAYYFVGVGLGMALLVVLGWQATRARRTAAAKTTAQP